MRKTPRSLAVAGLALAAGLGVAATAVPVFAAQDPILTQDQRHTLQAQVDAYEACLAQQGVTLPDPSSASTDATKPDLTDAQRQAMRAARGTACESQEPTRPELSVDQQAELQSQQQEYRACLDEQLSAAGITKPEKPSRPQGDPSGQTKGQSGQQGQRPARPQITDEQKAAFDDARTACADTAPDLGVDGLAAGRGLGGHGGPGRMGPGGPQGQSGGQHAGTNRTTGATV